MPWVQLAGAKPLAVTPESAWQHNNQHVFKIAAQPVVAKVVIGLDEIEGCLDAAKGNLGLVAAWARSNPQSINAPAGSSPECELIGKG